MGNYLQSFGKDSKGVYLSIYDKWDFEIGDGGYYGFGALKHKKIWEAELMALIGEPINIYMRYYIPESDIRAELEKRPGILRRLGGCLFGF